MASPASGAEFTLGARSARGSRGPSKARSVKAKKIDRQRGIDAVTKSLQAYADRGVLRAFSVSTTVGGRRDFAFKWLAPHSMAVTYNPTGGALVFRNLLHDIAEYPETLTSVRSFIKRQAGPGVPAHKHIDPARTTVRCVVREGHLSLSMKIEGSNHAYAVQRGLNLVNEVFVHLQHYHPAYLIERFGHSDE